jgi:hypothetical protein
MTPLERRKFAILFYNTFKKVYDFRYTALLNLLNIEIECDEDLPNFGVHYKGEIYEHGQWVDVICEMMDDDMMLRMQKFVVEHI